VFGKRDRRAHRDPRRAGACAGGCSVDGSVSWPGLRALMLLVLLALGAQLVRRQR